MTALLTNSAMSTARACLRLYRLRYVDCLRPLREDDGARALGSLVHVGLEAWWKHPAADGIEPLTAAIVAMHAVPDVEPYALARAEAMLIGYHARWASERPLYETLAVEVEFRTPLVNHETGALSRTYELGGKLDVVVRELASGRLLLVEHKTSSEDITPGSLYWRRLRMDGQISTYFEGAASLGYDVAGCLYDVLKKPALRPLQANSKRSVPETPEEFRFRLHEATLAEAESYYSRGLVVRFDGELADAARDRWQTATLLRDATRTGTFPRNPDACMRYGRCCEFFDACSGTASLDDPFLWKRLANPHTELTKESRP